MTAPLLPRTRVLDYRVPLGAQSAAATGLAVPPLAADSRPGAIAARRQLALSHADDSYPEIDRLQQELQKQQAVHAARLKETAEQERAAGYAVARAEAEQAYQEKLARVEKLMVEVEQSSRNYLVEVEREVVALVLDMAHRILHHEAQIDPLLLRGAVRVALDAIREGGEIRLLVPEQQCAAWQAETALLRLDGKEIVVEGVPTMAVGECRCRLATGTLDLGVRAQLGEVERSFEKLLQVGGARGRTGSRAALDAESSEPDHLPVELAKAAAEESAKKDLIQKDPVSEGTSSAGTSSAGTSSPDEGTAARPAKQDPRG